LSFPDKSRRFIKNVPEPNQEPLPRIIPVVEPVSVPEPEKEPVPA